MTRSISRRCSPLLSALGLLAVLGSCANPADSAKVANKENFTKAIQTWEQAHPEQTKVCASIETFVSQASNTYYPSIRSSSSFPLWEGLSKLGYLTIEEVKTNADPHAVKVAVTPKYIQDFGQPSEVMTDACVGSYKLDRIDDFSEPGEINGIKASAVATTVKQTVTAAWTKDAGLTQLIDYTAPAPERKVRYLLVLNDSGWVVANSVRR